MSTVLPPIPAKRYFTIGEVAELCGVKPHVLRYWEQEFTQLRPMKRRGNRRYYQHHEVLMVRRIRDLLYDQGFTISGARNRLQELAHSGKAGVEQLAVGDAGAMEFVDGDESDFPDDDSATRADASIATVAPSANAASHVAPLSIQAVRKELQEIRALLSWV
ncbi:MerR family transcriptional regulator [Diaphorobacter sp. HDW4B]|uniref:MerR family transcriptional regulator n=1 Tax=Diaphorobacter sp. HDW4B TaxID=2714925 RepID=UPI0014079B20|nr:MerR family transcriptional regulator [Diaphorobacter sp. HDW4B]QIL69377.1 MerR family transcriptional regulator [Diaphorobacter sp. HDW4B]